jgi:hypothetical protein
MSNYQNIKKNQNFSKYKKKIKIFQNIKISETLFYFKIYYFNHFLFILLIFIYFKRYYKLI